MATVFSIQVALLGQLDPNGVEAMYQYGRNVGIAFQLIDDLLDFSQSADKLGKPAHADLQLGLATAPVLFAAEKVSCRYVTCDSCYR